MCILIYLYMDLSAPPLQYFRFTHFGRGVVDELDAHRKKKKKTNTGFLSSFDLLAVQMRSMAWAASQHCSHAIMHGEPEPWHKWITKFMLCQRKNALGFGIWPRRSRLLWLLCASLAAGSVRGMIWHLRGRARSSGAHRLEVRWAAERMKWQWIIKYEARESSTKLSYL